MKLRLTLTPLLLAIIAPVYCAAQAGKVGNVTLVLSSMYEQGGFKDSEGNPTEVKETSTATQDKVEYRYITKKVKYSNKEFLADLVTKGTLTAPAKDWSIKYVQSEDNSSVEGVYAVKKSGEIVYLGGYYADSQFAVTFAEGDGYTSHAKETEIITYNSPEKTEENVKTYSLIESWKETYTVFLTLRPTSNSEGNFQAIGLFNSGGYYAEKYTASTDTETSTYKVPASSLTNIVGEAEVNEAILQGSIRISAQADVADISAYVQAYLAVNQVDS
jgi:hypothetical protein